MAVALYALSQLQQHGKLKWSKHDDDFWGRDSDRRKYHKGLQQQLIPAPNKWYYKKFNIKYVEKFPLSATLFVAFTDGYHAMQFLVSKLVIISIVTFEAKLWYWHSIGYLATWYIVFHIFYYTFSRKHAA